MNNFYRFFLNNMRKYLIIIIIFIINVTMNNNLYAENIKCNFNFSENTFMLGEPIYIDFNLINESNDTFQINLGAEKKGKFEFVIFKEKELLKLTKIPIKFGLTPLIKIKLEPYKVYYQKILLNEFYSLKSPGKYTLKVKFETNIIDSKNSEQEYYYEENLELIITPKNKEELDKICSQLTKEILHSTSENFNDTLLALSYISDNSAIPYIEKIIFTKEMNDRQVYEFIKSFRKTGTIEAIKSLVKIYQNHNNKNISDAAKLELKIILGNTTDQTIKNYLSKYKKIKPIKSGNMIID